MTAHDVQCKTPQQNQKDYSTRGHYAARSSQAQYSQWVCTRASARLMSGVSDFGVLFPTVVLNLSVWHELWNSPSLPLPPFSPLMSLSSGGLDFSFFFFFYFLFSVCVCVLMLWGGVGILTTSDCEICNLSSWGVVVCPSCSLLFGCLLSTVHAALNRHILYIQYMFFLPVEYAPVTELLLRGVRGDIVVQVDKLWEEISDHLCGHHYGGLSREAGSAHR